MIQPPHWLRRRKFIPLCYLLQEKALLGPKQAVGRVHSLPVPVPSLPTAMSGKLIPEQGAFQIGLDGFRSKP